MLHFEKHGMIIMIALSIISPISIIVTALVAKDTEYENAFFYVLAFWLVLLPVLDMYLKKKNKGR
jgi:predicted membrane channel-forming protein YqfA (hemolysin III family)